MCLLLLLGLGFVGCSIGLGRAAEAAPLPQPVTPRILPPRPVPPPMAAVQPPSGGTVDEFLKWDEESKKLSVASGTAQAHFTFILTNVSKETVTIQSAVGTCFCTVAKLPELPWKIAPGATGEINVTMDIGMRTGTLQKGVTVVTDKGVKMLNVTTTVLPAPAQMQMAAGDREANLKLATADRQAVFTKTECASCHAEPAKNKAGKELYEAVCGVCHESPRRATMVPNLHTITQETNAEFWKNWIAHGKPGSFMPAFAQAEGGILSEDQINSLVKYLLSAMPSKATAAAAGPTPMAN